MSEHVQVEVDCLATARRILSSPVAVYSATPFEIVAMAACTVRESSGVTPDLPVIGDPPPPSASLAAAVARLLRADHQLTAARRQMLKAVARAEPTPDLAPVIEEFNAALAALHPIFEKEFPHGSA